MIDLPDQAQDTTPNGLSKVEQDYFAAQFTNIQKGMQIQIDLLRGIRNWNAFFGILLIIGLVVTILRGCVGL